MHTNYKELVGRNEEMKILENRFDKAIEGSFEVVLLKGLSGTGKTTLIHNCFTNLTKNKGYFITGKFDKNSMNEPYKPFIQAFSHIIHYFLSESNKRIAEVRLMLIKILGTNSSMISTLIPEIELIIGKQQEVKDFDVEKVKLRFERVFIKFIQVFATKNHPLVLFIDDLQWADETTIELLKVIIASTKNKYLLIIGTYREEEVDENHPIMGVYEEILNAKLSVQDMSISNLTLIDTYHLVKNYYGCTDDQGKVLSKEIYLKTFGNPFYTKQMLSIIDQENGMHQRAFNLEEKVRYIQTIEQNQRILDIVFEKIKNNSEHMMPLIKKLACLGVSFSLRHFCIVEGCTKLEGAARLKEVIDKNIILPFDDKGLIVNNIEYAQMIETDGVEGLEFEFIHDNIYITAFDLLDHIEKKHIYLDLGRKLVDQLTASEIEHGIYKIAAYFNYDSNQITDEVERLSCARINYQAGLKAKTTSALILAEKVFQKALALVPKSYARLEFDINYELYQCLFINRKYEEATICVNRLMISAESRIDKAKIHSLNTILYSLVSRYKEALDEGIKALSYLDVHIQNKNYMVQLGKEAVKATLNFRNSRLPKLAELTEVNSEENLLALKTLARIAAPANLFNEDLFAIVILKLANISAEEKSKYSQVGFSSFAIVARNIFDDIEKVKVIEEMVHELCEEYQDEELICLTYFILGTFVTHWNHHGNKSLEYSYKSYYSGIETGDLFFSGYSTTTILETKYAIGKPLTEIASDCIEFHKYAINIDFDIILDLISIISNMTKEFSEPKFNDDLSHVFEVEKKLIEKGSNEIMTYYIILMQLYLLSGKLDKALDIGDKAFKMKKSIEGYIMYTELLFIYALTITQNFNKLDQRDQLKYRKVLNKIQKEMKKFSGYAKDNYEHKYLLVEAELFRISGDHVGTMACYDQAIMSAIESGYTQNVAISNEYAAQYYKSVDRRKVAKVYINEAYNYYEKWGASAKCNQIMDIWQDDIKQVENDYDPSTKSGSMSQVIVDEKKDDIHIEHIIGIYNDISTHAMDCEYFEALLKGIVQFTDATKGAILIEEKGDLYIDEYFDPKVGYSKSHDLLETSQLLPQRVIRYVGRTNEDVLIQDGIKESIFMKDIYISENNAQNIISIPFIYNGISIGVIYLEAYGESSVFSETYCESIKLIIHKAVGDKKFDHLVIEDLKGARQSNIEDIKLSKREIEVLILLGEGKSNKEIADELYITIHTIKTHLINLYNKLEVNSRIQAVIKATKIGLIE